MKIGKGTNFDSLKHKAATVRKVRETKVSKPVPLGAPVVEEPEMVETSPEAIPQEELDQMVEKSKEYKERNIDTLEKLEYSIVYEPLCNGKIPDIPETLNYKAIDGFMITKLNELTMATIDEGMNDILDSSCYESIVEGFSHWILPLNEKIRAFINLRLNSVGPVIEGLIGICPECGERKVFPKIHITKFDETELKENYQEPFSLHATVKNKEVKFKGRLLRTGDIYKAMQIYKKDKKLIREQFPQAHDEKDKTIVCQILEYANSILEIEEKPTDFITSIKFCRDNADVMNAITSFNDYFLYGISLTTEGTCDNMECSSVTKDEKTGKPTKRRCQFRIPLQPTIFYITYSEEETAKRYFDL
jgi:hypothetical protein